MTFKVCIGGLFTNLCACNVLCPILLKVVIHLSCFHDLQVFDETQPRDGDGRAQEWDCGARYSCG